MRALIDESAGEPARQRFIEVRAPVDHPRQSCSPRAVAAL